MGRNLFELFSAYTPDEREISLIRQSQGYRVRYDRRRRIIEIEIHFKSLADKKIIYGMEEKIRRAYDMNGVKILSKYPARLLCYDYIPQILLEAERVGVAARGFFDGCKYSFDGEKIVVGIKTFSEGVHMMNDCKTPEIIDGIVFSEFGVRTKTEIVCSERMEEYGELIKSEENRIDEELKKARAETEIKEEVKPEYERVTTLNGGEGGSDVGRCEFDFSGPEFVYGKKFKIEPVNLGEVKTPLRSAVIVGEVFNYTAEPTRQGDKVNISFSVTDFMSSVDVRKYGCATEEAENISDIVKDGEALAMRGFFTQEAIRKFDGVSFKKTLTNELIFVFRDLAKVKRKKRVDRAEKKRVELHLHTNMSSMDAVITPEELVKTMTEWGHGAFAVTDHDNLQAYPEIMTILEKEKSDIKPIYGLEANFVNNKASAVFGKASSFDGNFTVFDIETTGLSAADDRIIEIGAVRLSNGEIKGSFDTFVDPKRKLSEKITDLTGIKDSDLEGAPGEAEAVSMFLDFSGGDTLIAHNAAFDTGFIRRVCESEGIKFDNPYIDTLPLSVYLNGNFKNHKLDTLVTNYGIGDFRHHRASDDAAVLGEIFLRMIKQMRELDISDPEVLKREMAEHTDPLKMRSSHMTVLVKNKTGLRNIYKIVSESNLSYFYKFPKVPKTLLEKYRDGLIIGSGCTEGELFSAFVENKSAEETEKIASFYDFLEIQPAAAGAGQIEKGYLKDEDAVRNINVKIYELGKKLCKPVVATSNAHYINREDRIFRDVIIDDEKGFIHDKNAVMYLPTTDEMLEEFSYLGKEAAYEVVVENSNLIADSVEKIRPIPAGKFTPKMEGAEEELEKCCYERAKELYGDPLPRTVSERLEKELGSIIKNGFAVLYIIAKRLVKFSEENGYLVGSRGSVGSSFVASMAGISEVNPLPPHYRCPKCRHSEFITDHSYGSGFDLPDKKCPVCGTPYESDGHDIPFETFLGFYGDKSPDIDLNFSGDVQGKVHKYTEELFGSENVFRAGTIGKLADKTAYGILSKYLEKRQISLPRAEKNRIVNGCVGVKRTTGQHPGGIIVIPRNYEVYDFTPVQHPAGDRTSDVVTTHFAFKYLDETILKLDELGHDIPTKYKWLEKFSGIPVSEVKMNDRAIYELFYSTRPLGVSPEDIDCDLGTFGLPELGTRFAIQLLKEAKPRCFADLLQIEGLSHGVGVWAGNAEDDINNNVCDIKTVIGCRDSIMLDLIAKGLDKSLAFKIMESVRKGRGLKPEWEKEMRERGVPEWYIASCKKIKYMFPKAHAAAYVMSAIRLAWYKVHEPLAFYCAMFTVSPDGVDGETVMLGKQKVMSTFKEIESRNGKDISQRDAATVFSLQLVNECYARGIKFLGVDLNKSDAFAFMPEGGSIRLPFVSLGGLGETAAGNIVAEREKGAFFSVDDLKVRAGLSRKVIDILRCNGVLDGMSETDQIAIDFSAFM